MESFFLVYFCAIDFSELAQAISQRNKELHFKSSYQFIGEMELSAAFVHNELQEFSTRVDSEY